MRTARWVVLVILAVFQTAHLEAGGPLLVYLGAPLRWSTARPLTLRVDPGPLGSLSNSEATAILFSAAREWSRVPTSRLEVRLGDFLSEDVEDLSFSEFNALVNRQDGVNPVIFDSSGQILDALFGEGSGVLGAAGPSLVVYPTRSIIKGFAVFNGRGITQKNANRMAAVMTHELGHLLNLGHAQLNGPHIGLSIPGFSGAAREQDVETMYPLLLDSSETPHPMTTLHRDDIAAISALYPTSDFAATTGTLSGMVFDIDGLTPLQGVNVVARNVAAPFTDCVSFVSGHLAGAVPAGSGQAVPGAFVLQGLTSGATYKVYIEEVGSFFTGGSSVGPFDPPRNVDPTNHLAFLELWSGDDESAENPPDDPHTGASVTVAAAETRSDIDFIFNGVAPRLEAIEPPAGSYREPQRVTVTGSNLLQTVAVRLDSSFPAVFEDVEILSASTLAATVPAGITPGTYFVIVSTSKGQNEIGEVSYTVTEPPPRIVSVEPQSIENSRWHRIGIDGTDLLGTWAARLTAPEVPDVPLEVQRVFPGDTTDVADTVLAQVPAGVYPGMYDIVVANTAGESAPGSVALLVTELPPVLSGTAIPSTAPSSSAPKVKIQGENLTGTTVVELLRDDKRVSLVIESTTLTEVVVRIPAGLGPGSYRVSLTNTRATVTGPTEFTVAPPQGGGGGGCGVVLPSRGPPGRIDLPLLLFFLIILRWWRAPRPRRTRNRERTVQA